MRLARIDCANALRLARLDARGTASAGSSGVKPNSRIAPVSTNDSRALTARALNRPLVCASGGPPMMATADPLCVISCASRLMTAAGHSGLLFDRFGRVVGQARGPAVDERAGARSRALRRELFAQDDVRDAQRKGAFHSRPAWNPLVGIGAGLRHPRFHLHEFCPAPGAALAHLAVTDRLRHRRVPGAEEISAEGDHIVGAAKIERGQRGVAEAEQIRLAQYGFIEGLVPDRAGRAISLSENARSIRGAGRERAAPERQERWWISMICNAVRCAANSFSASSQRYFLKFAGAARAGALDGMGDAVGMVEHLQASLAARAELSPIDGMLGLPSSFFARPIFIRPCWP